MEKLVYLNNLYDLYGILLTEKQQTYFEEYYFNNLSYGEISEKYNISRNACFKQLKIIEDKLFDYEKKLKLYYKKEKINDIIKLINDKNLKKELENLL
ncbi:MAG: YlxM family DNA-binding protein [Bacilli bacterium]